MKLSAFALRSAALSTSSRMRDAVDCSNGRVTSMVSTPVRFTQPDSASCPTVTSRGSDSPVSAAVSRADEPDVMTPSSGTRSPGRTRIVSPIATSAGSTSTISSPRRRFALSGRMSMSAEIDRLERSTATLSNSSPTWKNSMTPAASAYSPSISAPIVARLIRKFSSNT